MDSNHIIASKIITLLCIPSGSSVILHLSLSFSRSPNRLSSMALAMGSIMAVVAELLNHMDRKEDVNIIPKINLKKKALRFTGEHSYTAGTLTVTPDSTEFYILIHAI